MRGDKLGIALLAVLGAVAVAAVSICRPPSTAPALPPPLATSHLEITPSDAAFAREVCKRRGLMWSRLELSLDNSKVNVICESSEVVRAQITARYRDTHK